MRNARHDFTGRTIRNKQLKKKPETITAPKSWKQLERAARKDLSRNRREIA